MDLGSILGPRPIEDILAERIVIVLGGKRHTLPVLAMRQHREWEEALDPALVQLLNTVRDDGDDIGAVIRALASSAWPFVDLLLSYAPGLLPGADEIVETNTELGLLIAILEVWRAGHPLADIGLELVAMIASRESSLPGLTSTLWPRGPDTPTELSKQN